MGISDRTTADLTLYAESDGSISVDTGSRYVAVGGEDLERILDRLAADGGTLRLLGGVGRADDGADVTREHRLHAPQQRLDRLAVANLRAQHPLRLLWGCHSPPSIAERRGGWFGISGAVRSV